MLLIFHTIVFIDWKFGRRLNCVCGYDSNSTAAAGRQRVCSSVYPIPPSLAPLFLSLSFPISLLLPVIPTICCLQNKSFIYCHFQDCLYLSSDHYANHSRNRGANYQTIWRKLALLFIIQLYIPDNSNYVSFMWPRSSQAVQHTESNGSWQQGLLASEDPEYRLLFVSSGVWEAFMFHSVYS